MIVQSETTGKYYEDEDCVFFRNYIQAAKYISWGAKIIDLFTDGSDKLVYVFSKLDHNKYKLRWGKFKETKFKENDNGRREKV